MYVILRAGIENYSLFLGFVQLTRDCLFMAAANRKNHSLLMAAITVDPLKVLTPGEWALKKPLPSVSGVLTFYSHLLHLNLYGKGDIYSLIKSQEYYLLL